MHVRAFPAQIAFLDKFLCIVPSTTRIGHGQRQQDTPQQGAAEHTAQRRRPEQKPHHHWCTHSQHAGRNHPLQGRCGGNFDTPIGIRLCGTFHQSWDFFELPPNLADHVKGRITHRRHRHTAHQKREYTAEKHAGKHDRIVNLQFEIGYVVSNGFDIGRNNGHRRQGSSADCETLTNCRCCIAELIQLVGDLTDLFPQPCHLSDTTRVVRDRTIGVDGHGNTDRRQHTHRSNPDTIKT